MKWKDTDKPVTTGCFVRKTNSHVVFLVQELKDGWVSVVQARQDGKRDRRAIGWSGLAQGLIVVEQESPETSAKLFVTTKEGETLCCQRFGKLHSHGRS